MKAPKQTKESWAAWFNFARSLIMVFATNDLEKENGLKVAMYKLNSYQFVSILENLVNRAKDPNSTIKPIKNLPGLAYFDKMLQAAGLLTDEEISDVEEGLDGLKLAKENLKEVSNEIRREWDDKPAGEKAEIITAHVAGKAYGAYNTGKAVGLGIFRGIQKGFNALKDSEAVQKSIKETMGQ